MSGKRIFDGTFDCPSVEIPTIHPVDAVKLVANGELSRPENGAVRLHRRRLGRGHYTSTITDPDFSDDNTYVTVPTNLYSEDAVKRLGFTSKAAQEIMQRWERVDMCDRLTGDGPITLDDIAKAGIMCGDFDPVHDWAASMRDWGLDEELIEAIMDPRYEQVRMTNTCRHWVEESIDMRWDVMFNAHWSSHRRAIDIDELRPAASSTSEESLWGVNTALEADTAETLLALLNKSAPAQVTLWAGKSAETIRRAFSGTDGQLRSSAGLEIYPSDFSRDMASYWDVEKDMAIRWVLWARRRAPVAIPSLLRLDLADTLLQSLPKSHLYFPSEEWKRTVGWARLGVRCLQVAEDDPWLVIGHKFKLRQDQPALDRNWENFTLDNVALDSNGEPAVQYAFTGDCGGDFIDDHCLGAITRITFTTKQVQLLESVGF